LKKLKKLHQQVVFNHIFVKIKSNEIQSVKHPSGVN